MDRLASATRIESELRLALAFLLVLLCTSNVLAQAVDPLSQQFADARVELERLAFLVRSLQIDDKEYRARVADTNKQIQGLRAELAKRPRDQQARITQEQESIFQVRVLPLRDQWARETQERLAAAKKAAQEKDAQIRAELTSDAGRAGQLQASRSLMKDKLQRNEISQADFAAADQQAEQEVLALQRKFDAHGANYGRLFTQTVVQVAAKATADLRLQDRLRDTSSPVGQDAHSAAELTLSMKKNEAFRLKRVITPQQEQAMNSDALIKLTALNAKYPGTAAADYQDRVNRLVQVGVTERTAQWASEADAALQSAASAATTAAQAAPAPSAPLSPNTRGQRQGAATTSSPRPGAVQGRTYIPPVETRGTGIGNTITEIMGGIASLIQLLVIVGLIGLVVVNKIRKSPRREMRRTNAEALEAIGGTDPITREQKILDAFDNDNTTFKFSIHNRRGKVYFVLLRNIKSMKGSEREALRLAYLLFNRKGLDNEHFNWIRFSMVYGGGQTLPSEWKFLGIIRPILSIFKRQKGQMALAKAGVEEYAGRTLMGIDIETWSISLVNKLVESSPNDHLYLDAQRRLIEGPYWLGKSDVRKSAFAPNNSKYVVRFGILDGSDAEITYGGEGSIITIAPPRSGKTQCNVFPNLLTWPGPAVVLDVKGEIYAGTSKWRSQNVGPVIKFAPLDPENSARFNPLAGVRSDPMYIWEDSRFVADMMVVPNKEAKDPFWENRAREVLTAIIADLSFWNEPEDRAMSKVLTIVNRGGWADFVKHMQTNPEVSAMRDEGNSLAQTDPKTLDGILQTLKSSLAAWVGERINKVTQKSDWSPMDLRSGKNPTIYVCLKPNEVEAYISLLRVFIAQHIRALTSELPPRDAAPILFVLDELPRLGRMPPVEEALEIGSQYGIRLWMFAQSLGQLQTAYPNADGMIGSCAVRSFMNPSIHDGTAELVSNQIGYKGGEQHGGKGQDMLNKADSLIVTPSDLAGPKYKELQIVMAVGSKPARVRKMYAHQSEQLKSRMASV